MSNEAKPAADGPAPVVIAEVKYSLPALLHELKAERSGGSFGMEKLDQSEIGKLFKANVARRPKPKK